LIIVSACLAGINCRYDGGNSASEKVRRMVSLGRAVPVCPEQLGGLATPRPPAEILSGDGYDVLAGKASVVNSQGEDVTSCYIRGAGEVLEIARLFSAGGAVLKDKSPACGAGFICRGGEIAEGFGVCAAMLVNEGIEVKSSGEDY
jgi:uncharacterized protein YbbK (DUF523 family)